MKILFQGDSITETGRDESDPTNLGVGYPKYAAERIAARHPDIDFTFYNLGISGNMTESLRDRWQTDCIDYDPDFVSILVGVNDTWHGDYVKSWVPNEHYEACYRHCLEEIKNKTNAKILILEQFLVPPCLLLSHARPDFDAKKQITRKLAREYADAFIPLDGIFAAHSLQVDPVFWAKDGIHPTETGAQLIADLYVDAFERIFPRLTNC